MTEYPPKQLKLRDQQYQVLKRCGIKAHSEVIKESKITDYFENWVGDFLRN